MLDLSGPLLEALAPAAQGREAPSAELFGLIKETLEAFLDVMDRLAAGPFGRQHEGGGLVHVDGGIDAQPVAAQLLSRHVHPDGRIAGRRGVAGHAGAVGHCVAVAGRDLGIGCLTVDLPAAAGSQDGLLGPKDLVAVVAMEAGNPAAAAVNIHEVDGQLADIGDGEFVLLHLDAALHKGVEEAVHHDLRAPVHRDVRDGDEVGNPVGGPVAVSVHDELRLVEGRAVAGGDDVDCIPLHLLDVALHDRAEGHHDLGEVTLRSLVDQRALSGVHVRRGEVRTEEVA